MRHGFTALQFAASLLGGLAASLATSAAVLAQKAPSVTLRYTTGAPQKTPWVTQLERFAKDVDEESKGDIKIDAFIAAQLGNEQDTIQQIARGRIDMGGFLDRRRGRPGAARAVRAVDPAFLFKRRARSRTASSTRR